MTVAPVSVMRGPGRPHGRLARWAVGLSALSGVAFAAVIAAIAIAYAIGEGAAVEDTTLSIVLLGFALAGLVGSVAAFVMAVIAAARHERWALLWLPACLFPAIILFIVLGEALLWE